MMKIRFLFILLALLGGLALWSSGPTSIIAQQAGDHEDHTGHDHGKAKADEHAGHDADGHAGHAHDKQAAKPGNTDGHDDHAGHGDEEDEGGIRIAPEVMREFGIEVRPADGGHIEKVMRLPGEVVYNSDRIANVTPTVSGIVRRVSVSVGDRVDAGRVIAVLSSRELAVARSKYLSTQARLALAKNNLKSQQKLYESRLRLAEASVERDRRLFEEKVGSERTLLESQQALEEIRIAGSITAVEALQAVDEVSIALSEAETELHALGLDHDQIEGTGSLEHEELSRYQLMAPLSGLVTERRATVGEVIEPGNGSPIVVADLSTVWVNLTVYQRDLAHVQAGQHVTIRFGHGIPDAEGEIAFISPSLEEKTRTATARIVLKNPDGHWRPGLFVEGRIETGRVSASVVVPRNAITELDGEQVVFVQTDEGFEPRKVTVGRTTPESAEIVAGLKPGDRYVARNVLAFKAEMNRAALEHAGHAH